MHSEHDLQERQRRTNHSESFPLWGATFLHNPWHRGPEARWMPYAPLRRRRRPLREYRKAPPKSQSRSRPRRRRLNPQARQGLSISRQRRHKKWRPKGRPPHQRSDTIYLPRAEALNPSGRRQPIPDRTLAAQGQRPGGWLNPHAHKGVSTFGNTGKRRPADWYLSRDDSLPAYTARILHRMRESAKVGP